MPIDGVTPKLRTLGHIRMGKMATEPSDPNMSEEKRKKWKPHPIVLKTWRFTSPDAELLEQVARIYGGEVEPWKGPSGPEYELICLFDQIAVTVPPDTELMQWYEQWNTSGLVARCDGAYDMERVKPCSCPSDPDERTALAAKGEACVPTTRLWLMLPGVPTFGAWQLVTGSWYAAQELAGTIGILKAASAMGRPIPALLGMDPRKTRRKGKTRSFKVPVVTPSIDIGNFLELVAGDAPAAQPALVSPDVPGDEPPYDEAPAAPEDTAPPPEDTAPTPEETEEAPPRSAERDEKPLNARPRAGQEHRSTQQSQSNRDWRKGKTPDEIAAVEADAVVIKELWTESGLTLSEMQKLLKDDYGATAYNQLNPEQRADLIGSLNSLVAAKNANDEAEETPEEDNSSAQALDDLFSTLPKE